ncbi:hypothetical protein BDP27DRAFT_1336660 [Rhodocollybia butyracea]|uniref:F-box domain-containing protein n=1 Tax=Rhodocollybia butyracea TaxID=206335 RepID=A0A9P5U1J7_9AGAR|nr:hypothetical protein BDP27DRAFT_1336660 [Rhodocollybia butyracea]
MSKHRIASPTLPPPKRPHLSLDKDYLIELSFQSALSDELVLSIFSHLDMKSLCAAQATSGNWSRLATDNELWKNLYLRTFGRPRLRGARGFVGRSDGRQIKALPGRAGNVEELKDWKFMFRISSNWKNGRCAMEDLRPRNQGSESSHVLLVGSLTITATSQASLCPSVHLQSPTGVDHILSCPIAHSAHITTLALDQSAPSTAHIRLAVFLSSGEFRMFSINHNLPSLSHAEFAYTPSRRSSRTCPIIKAVYHHPLLITLSESFSLSFYDLSSGSAVLTQTLTSFTTYPPTSLVLSTTPYNTYKLVLAYAIPLPHSSSFLTPEHNPMTIISTRTARALDVPQGWVDEKKLRLMREQWGRKVSRVADTQTDGKWVVLAPEDPASSSTSASSSSSAPSSPGSSSSSSSSPYTPSSSIYSPTSLQLYRLSLPSSTAVSSSSPKLTFVRNLRGQLGPVSALALSDGRCVSFGVNGSIWVWDLEADMGTEVACPGIFDKLELMDAKRSVVFDERRIVTAVNEHVVERRFDI